MRTRFAPSPTGPLHLGHAYSAILAHDMARAAGGAFLLRIEDIDQSRARPEWEALIHEDLHWLGLTWEDPVMRQSERGAVYRAALDRLWRMGLLYPCKCKRRDILAAANAPQEGAPIIGPDGVVYQGTCRPDEPPGGARPEAAVLRLNMAAAVELMKNGQSGITDKGNSTSTFPTFNELSPAVHRQEKTVNGPNSAKNDRSLDRDDAALTYESVDRAQMPLTYRTVNLSPERLISDVGDVVLARRDMGTSYHLSVVVDDAAQNITHVIRGADLFDATPIHVVLQVLLGLPTPKYYHHRLIRDEAGKRLAKRDNARALRLFREEGKTPDDIRQMVGLGPSPL